MAKNNDIPVENTAVEETAPVAPTPADATAEMPADAATEPVPTKRDNFRSRVSQRYPELNMDDEDAYYDQMGGMMDEYEGYEKNTQRLRDTMTKTPAFAEMLLAAREQEDFDPVVWMVKERGLDLQSAMDDPEYADKIAQARADYMAKEAKGKELIDNMSNNLPGTLEKTQQALDEAGMGDKFDDVVAQLFQFADDVTNGTWDPQIAVMIAKGADYDSAVSGARDEGMAQGLNQKVDDKLRKLESKKERVAGTQTPVKPKAPKKPSSNMFMA